MSEALRRSTMAKANVQFTKDNEYYTPKEFVDKFGKFDYDPATTKEKAKEFGINNYDTIETNGLTKDWTIYKRIWINPPFTIKADFIKKAWETYQIAKNEIYILFPIEFLTTAKFYNSVKGGKIYIPNGRINFESGLGKKGKSPAFGSIVMKIQNNWEIELIDK
jgi:phage N-6-adenine-methyltransferase